MGERPSEKPQESKTRQAGTAKDEKTKGRRREPRQIVQKGRKGKRNGAEDSRADTETMEMAKLECRERKGDR